MKFKQRCRNGVRQSEWSVMPDITEAFDKLFNEKEDEDDNKVKGRIEAFIPTTPKKDHECEEGMTEIGGWMICKHCGKNLREIK